MKNTIELTPPREKTKTEPEEHRSQCSEWKHCTGMGGRQSRVAVEAVADVAHGGRVVLCVVCVCTTHKSFGVCRVFVQYSVSS